ncbi:6,7-dimethyl-8-ribityllumazine synthase, partial [Globisporangium splendens]
MATKEIRRIGFIEEDDRGLKFGIVALLAKDVARNGLSYCTVQRQFDLPYATKAMMRGDDSLDGVVCLGCIIRDEDASKLDCKSEAVAHGIMRLNEGKVRVAYGVLVCLSEEQALTFIGKASDHDPVSDDHGSACAQTLVELARLSKQLDEDAEDQP